MDEDFNRNIGFLVHDVALFQVRDLNTIVFLFTQYLMLYNVTVYTRSARLSLFFEHAVVIVALR